MNASLQQIDLQKSPAGDVDALWLALVEDFLAHAKSTPDRLSALLAAEPEHFMGWCAKGFFAVLLARCELRIGAEAALAKLEGIARLRGASRLQRVYVYALREAVDGEFDRSIAYLDAIVEADPNDSFATKLAHALRFMRGDTRGMQRSIDLVIKRCDQTHPHLGYLLGCQAFALEETGQYADAERAGREGVLRAPRDAWGVHAVAHVHEMTGQARIGIDWLTMHERNVSHCNNFGGHVFWHLALFRLEVGDHKGALHLYDSRIRADHTDDFRDIANAASLLGRLAIEGVDVGDRWDELADLAQNRIADRSLVFADLHYALALAGAGRTDKAAALAQSLGAPQWSGDQHSVSRAGGAAMADAIASWGDGQYARAAQLLLATRGMRQQLGGSHAQRDIFEQLTIDSLIKSGRRDEACDLLGQRLAARTRNRFAERRLTALMQSGARLAGQNRRIASRQVPLANAI